MSLPDSICMIPWISIETSPTGTARPCCLAADEIVDNSGNTFNLQYSTLEEIYKSNYLQDLRKQFRAGDKPKTCKNCWEEEQAGRTSKRQFTKIRLKELFPLVDWQNNLPDQLWFLDLKLGNICNLKCRICGSWSSSKWAEEEMNYLPPSMDKKKHIAYTWLKQGQWPRKSVNFWDNLKTLLTDVKYIEFTGGEPWLIDEHVQVLQYAVDHGLANNIEIHYNTNGTQWSEQLISIWKYFKRIDIAFSIDNIGKRFEYERYGASWDNVILNLETISILKQYYHNITTQLCFTVNIQNVYYLDELLAWADTQQFDTVYFNMLHNPDRMSVQKLTESAKNLVINKLLSSRWSNRFYENEIQNIVNFIKNGSGSNGESFVHNMKITDRYRNQNFLDTHTEIAKAMGYHV